MVTDEKDMPIGYINVYDIIHHALKSQNALHRDATYDTLENLLFAGKLFLSSTASEVMREHEFKSCSIDCSLDDLLKFLKEEKRSEVALVEENQKLVSFISLYDIVSYLVKVGVYL